MSKLLKLKGWLTIDEAAKHLSTMMAEPVSAADVYRLALNGHLRLSVNFVNPVHARRGETVGYEATEWMELYGKRHHLMNPLTVKDITENSYKWMTSRVLDADHFVNFSEKVRQITGVWDLVMTDGVRQDIERHFQNLTGGPEVAVNIMHEVLVERDGVFCELVQRFPDDDPKVVSDYDYYGANSLPDGSALVVKTDAIMLFLESVDSTPKKYEKSLSTKERQSMLVLIAALCKEAGINYNQKGIAVAIEQMTENLGSPLTGDTIRTIIRQIDDALTSRSSDAGHQTNSSRSKPNSPSH